MLAISHHVSEEQNQSNVFTVSASGGKPKRITKTGPSYLHSWSPDGKSLIFTGGRNGEFDIFKISALGGDETNLQKRRDSMMVPNIPLTASTSISTRREAA